MTKSGVTLSIEEYNALFSKAQLMDQILLVNMHKYDNSDGSYTHNLTVDIDLRSARQYLKKRVEDEFNWPQEIDYSSEWRMTAQVTLDTYQEVNE